MDWQDQAIIELSELETLSSEDWKNGPGSSILVDRFTIFPSYIEAEDYALARLKQKVLASPKEFNSDFLDNYLRVKPEEKKLLAVKLASRKYQEAKADDIGLTYIDEYSIDEHLSELSQRNQDAIKGYREKIEKLGKSIKEDDLTDEEIDSLDEELYSTQKEYEKFIQKAVFEDLYNSFRDKKINEETDRIMEGLEDPVSFLVEEGYYSKKDLVKQPFMEVDSEKASDDMLASEGVAKFISVDNIELTLPSGAVAYRVK